MNTTHHYQLTVQWTGNTGQGTASYRGYERSHRISAKGKPVIEASSDPAFRGDASRYNPEELLLASLSACHMLWFLHLCSDQGIVVMDYTDEPAGTMVETENGGRFTGVILRPQVSITDPAQVDKAQALHAEANRLCFIANSVNFPVRHEPACFVKS
jgi:organic hydroperoxide reductase OsmC/OhrA